MITFSNLLYKNLYRKRIADWYLLSNFYQKNKQKRFSQLLLPQTAVFCYS